MSKTDPAPLERENAELKEQVVRLERDLARLNSRSAQQTLAASLAGRAVIRVFLGSGLKTALRTLSDSLDEWGRGERKSFPRHETSDAVAAVLQRIFRAGLLWVTVAVLPAVILLIQTGFMWQQTQVMMAQNFKVQKQLDLQTEESRQGRKARMLAILYEPEPGCEERRCALGVRGCKPNICAPRADRRARSEAARAYVEMMRREDRTSDLSEARLRETDLSKMSLKRAQLDSADLYRANLSGSNLFGADMRGANLNRADLTDANLTKVLLEDANLNRIKWKGATCPDGTLASKNNDSCEGHLTF